LGVPGADRIIRIVANVLLILNARREYKLQKNDMEEPRTIMTP
jgi:hypothetical protein